MKRLLLLLFGVAFAAIGASATAANAYSQGIVHMRAGPSNRGWVYGNYLYYDYQNRRVPVLEFGASLGVGIVSFSIGDYWPRYYAGRPWYARENYWLHRPPPPRPAPAPNPPPGPN